MFSDCGDVDVECITCLLTWVFASENGCMNHNIRVWGGRNESIIGLAHR